MGKAKLDLPIQEKEAALTGDIILPSARFGPSNDAGW